MKNKISLLDIIFLLLGILFTLWTFFGPIIELLLAIKFFEVSKFLGVVTMCICVAHCINIYSMYIQYKRNFEDKRK